MDKTGIELHKYRLLKSLWAIASSLRLTFTDNVALGDYPRFLEMKIVESTTTSNAPQS